MWDETDKLAVLNRLRRNVIVHSAIYYRFNRNLLQDGDYDQLCVRLDEMQRKYPELCKDAVFPEDFQNYSPSTGMNFQDHAWGVPAAEKLLRGGRN